MNVKIVSISFVGTCSDILLPGVRVELVGSET